jgi:hypothetical protein
MSHSCGDTTDKVRLGGKANFLSHDHFSEREIKVA